MTHTDAPHRYQAQRDRIDALAVLAARQARVSGRLASRDFDNRSRHLADFDRMFRCVRAAAAWVVRLDQAAEGRLRQPSERAERVTRDPGEAVARTESAQPHFPSLPNFPHLDAEPFAADEPIAAAEAPAIAESDAPARPRTQSEIAREALRQRRLAAAGPKPPLRRTG